MSLSIADIDNWNPESISAVGAASTARANAAAEASSRLPALSAFNHWKGAGAGAAQARTQVLADGLEQHGQAASTVATAASTAANEVRQIKSQLSGLKSTLGQYGIIVDASGSRAVPPPNLSSMSAANRKLVQDITTMGQQSLDKIRQAADLADTHLAAAMKAKGTDDFNLDTQYARPASFMAGPGGAPLPESGLDCVAAVTQITGLTVAGGALTVATHSKFYGCGSGGAHCKPG
ncbi:MULTISPECIES: hypothetical protein [unclassified Mycobacterium]|uniref:hypothetical protein n=1 Tax=unclassified Mycobacterium TaxID=2642494 RepID=UPI0029C6B1A3|nr:MULTISPECIES: hypothetical protein [unclassified Mycobacterium]